MRLRLLLLSLFLASPAFADPTACHVTLTGASHRVDHHTTSCHAADDTKYDEKVDSSYNLRAGCKVSMDDGSVTIELDDAEDATGSMQLRQENEVVYGNHASGTTTISGKPGGTILLMKLPSGELLPQGSMKFHGHSTGQEHVHHNCDPSQKDQDSSATSDLDPLITPFDEAFMHQQNPGEVFTASPTFKISYDAFKAGFASHKPFTVSGAGSYVWHDQNTNADVHSDVQMTVDVGEATYEAVFVPDIGFDVFVPEGPKFDGASSKVGNTVQFHVELRDKKTHKPASVKFSAKLELASSRLPGTCMNWPAYRETAPDEADLVFEQARNKAGSVGSDGAVLQLPNGKGGELVTVSSRDYGGFATVSATVTTADGARVDVVTAASTSKLSIPRDDNDNHVADIWEKDHHVFESSLRPAADDEDYPTGLGSKGDGYTFFEEYRGFVQADPSGPLVIRAGSTPKLQHARFEPAKRDVFIGLSVSDPKDDAAILAGVRDYTTVSGFTVHYIARRDLLAPLHKADFTDAYRRRTDLRADDHSELFGQEAAGLWVATDIPPVGNTSPAFAWPIQANLDSQHPFHSPAQVRAVVVSHANAKGAVEWLISLIDPDAKLPPGEDEDSQANFAAWHTGAGKYGTPARHREVVAKARTQLDVLVARMMRFTVTHELGHATGAYHHAEGDTGGDKSCPMRYWQGSHDIVLDFLEGKWDATKAYNGHAWAWCTENLPQFNLRD